MRLFSILLSLSLCFLAMPGASELLENAGHHITEGHAAHDASHTHEHEHDAEHGCSGLVHTCACHSFASFLAPDLVAHLPTRTSVRVVTRPGVESDGPAGHERGVFRPPIA